MLNKPIFSVITPTYNCQNFILKSYECLIQQTEQNWEWIVVNDGSTDSSLEILSLIKDQRVKVFTYPNNEGRGNARNYALDQVQGEIVVIWDMDDLYFPNRLSYIKIALKDNDFDFFCSYALIVDNNLNIKGARYFEKELILSKSFVHPTLAFHSRLLNVIRYGENMIIGEDLNVMVYLVQKCKGYFCEIFLMLYMEEREVNLKKTLLSRINSHKAVKMLINDGVLTLPYFKWLKYLIMNQLKLFILNLMRLSPKFYIKTVKYRYLEPFDSGLLNQEEYEFIHAIKKKYHTNY